MARQMLVRMIKKDYFTLNIQLVVEIFKNDRENSQFVEKLYNFLTLKGSRKQPLAGGAKEHNFRFSNPIHQARNPHV